MLTVVRAPNPSAMTLDGTRVYITGSRAVAVIDPGPVIASHIDAIASAVAESDHTTILLTHFHPDHAEAARPLAKRLNARLITPLGLRDGEIITTDSGDLIALHTPGHTADHFAFHWPAQRAVFCGDLMMGGINTALVATPEGSMADYIASLNRIKALEPAIVYPSHGDPFDDPATAIDTYLAHREQRLEQVMAALSKRACTTDDLIAAIYGDVVDEELRAYLHSTTMAYIEYLMEQRRVERRGDAWSMT